jgi:hypothetical protein
LEEQDIVADLISLRGSCELWTWGFGEWMKVYVICGGQEYVQEDEAQCQQKRLNERGRRHCAERDQIYKCSFCEQSGAKTRWLLPLAWLPTRVSSGYEIL